MTYQELLAIIDKYLLLKDHSVVKFLMAIMIANKIEQLDPTWAFLITASSGGKSSLLEALAGIKSTMYLDSATSKTFFSGMKRADKETSFIFQIPDKGMLIMTDFTLMLDKDEQTNKDIMSTLRLIYDGKFNQRYGTGDAIEWTGRFGLLAGTTDIIYSRQQDFAALGQRMICYYMNQPDRIEATKMALGNVATKREGREVMKIAFTDFFNNVTIPTSLTAIPPELETYLIRLSEMSTRARSYVGRQKFHRDNPINNVIPPEMPMRMALQLLNLAHGLIALNPDRILQQEDYDLLYKVAIDSIPDQRRAVMEKMTAFMSAEIGGIAASLGWTFDHTKHTVEDLAALGVVVSSRINNKFYYELQPEYRQLISKTRHIAMTNQVLEKKQEEELAPPPVEHFIG